MANKSDKQILFEKMNLVAGMSLNENNNKEIQMNETNLNESDEQVNRFIEKVRQFVQKYDRGTPEQLDATAKELATKYLERNERTRNLNLDDVVPEKDPWFHDALFSQTSGVPMDNDDDDDFLFEDKTKSKDLLMERMHKVAGMPLNERKDPPPFNSLDPNLKRDTPEWRDAVEKHYTQHGANKYGQFVEPNAAQKVASDLKAQGKLSEDSSSDIIKRWKEKGEKWEKENPEKVEAIRKAIESGEDLSGISPLSDVSEENQSLNENFWERIKSSVQPEPNDQTYLEVYEAPTQNGKILMSVGWDQGYNDFTIFFPQLRHPDVDDQVIRISEDPQVAKETFELAKNLINKNFNTSTPFDMNKLAAIYNELEGRIRANWE